MQLNDDAMNKEFRTARGREILFVILRYFSTGKAAEVMYSIIDLQRSP